MKIRLGADELAYMKLFSTITKTAPVDCFEDGDSLVFLVPAEHMGRAIGKGGKTVKTVSRAFNKNVMVFPYSRDVHVMMKLLFPESSSSEVSDDSVVVSIPSKEKSSIMRNKRYLNIKRMIVKRLYGKGLKFKWS